MYEINKERLINRFVEMVKISSESLEENDFANYCKDFLQNTLGCNVVEDNAKEKTNGNQSNIIAKYYGNQRKRKLLFAVHMDTVKPGQNINPIIESDKIKSDGTTILGADDKSGVAALFEALLYIKENDLDIPDIDIVLTVAEEIGLLGAKYLDYSLIEAKEGYALDSEDIAGIFVKAPSQNFITISIEGIESHAGMSPEKGISAIKTAAEAIMNMPLGRIDTETTANIGIIQGGQATNIITKHVLLKGEVRSHNEDKLEFYTNKIKEAVYNACSNNRIQLPDGSVKTANCTINVERAYNSMNINENELVIKRAKNVYSKLNIPFKILAGGGGSDANIFNEHGIKTIILGTGMMDVHTVNEYIKIEDLYTITQIIIGILLNDE